MKVNKIPNENRPTLRCHKIASLMIGSIVSNIFNLKFIMMLSIQLFNNNKNDENFISYILNYLDLRIPIGDRF